MKRGDESRETLAPVAGTNRCDSPIRALGRLSPVIGGPRGAMDRVNWVGETTLT